jgi:hypothetical protein
MVAVLVAVMLAWGDVSAAVSIESRNDRVYGLAHLAIYSGHARPHWPCVRPSTIISLP